MRTNRLEAFSDGVLAIIITIMVLEFRAPAFGETHVPIFGDLIDAGLIPVFFSYVLSFVFIAIYWNNHHHPDGPGRVQRARQDDHRRERG